MNPTIVFSAPNVVDIENREKPTPGPGQILIETKRTLISTGTELTILSGDYPRGSYWADYGKLPFDPGYDNVGEIVEVGEGVGAGLIGKRAGTYGTHTAYVVSDVDSVRFIHRDISDEQAAFFTIAEIVMNGVRRSNTRWGESAVVYGLGLLGQLTVQFLNICGARPIFAVDVAQSRLNYLSERQRHHPSECRRGRCCFSC